MKRADQIEKLLNYYSKLFGLISFFIIQLVIFCVIPFLFLIYQKNIMGLENVIRSNPIGPITGYEPGWDRYFAKCNFAKYLRFLISPYVILIYFSFIIFYYLKYRNLFNDLPKIYHDFVKKQIIILEKLIIPIGIIMGTIIGFIIHFIQIPQFNLINQKIKWLFLLFPFIIACFLTLWIIFKTKKSIKIKYFISIIIVILLLF